MRKSIQKWSETALAAVCVGAILFAAVYTRQDDLRRMAAQNAAVSSDERLEEAARRAPWQRPTAGGLAREYAGAVRLPGGLWQGQGDARYACRAGEGVAAPGAGTVLRLEADAVWLEHGEGVQSRVGPLAALRVRVGDSVTAGQILGSAAGTEISLRVLRQGENVDPEGLFADP